MSFVIKSVDFVPLPARLLHPFVIAGAAVEQLDNCAVGITMESGHTGWGEIPVLPGVTPESAELVRANAPALREMLSGFEAEQWQEVSRRLALRFADLPGLCAGIEMAVIDAQARIDNTSLYRWFLGDITQLRTDITIPICPPAQAAVLASEYIFAGFDTLKMKVGIEPEEDLARLRAVHDAAPHAALVLDGNCGLTVAQTMDLLAALARLDIHPRLLEQPVAREDWEGMGYLNANCGVPLIADESCRTPEDARHLADNKLCSLINIKLAKSGVAPALEIINIARSAGIGLMIGGMVETRLAMGFSAHLAAAIGDFQLIDLDTPLLLACDPVSGGYSMQGPILDLSGSGPGHGAKPASMDEAF